MPTLYQHPVTITVEWTGDAPLALPKAFDDRPAIVLAVGRNTIRTDYWNRLGAYPAMVELIAAGTLRAVCGPHRFVEGEPVCMGCHFTREMAEEERKAAAAPKKAAQTQPQEKQS